MNREAALPDEARPETPRRQGFFQRSLFFWISLAAHALLIFIATVLVVQNIVLKKKTVFEAPSRPPAVSSRALEYKVSAPQASSSSAPVLAKRITAKGASKIALPEMPAMPDVSEVLPAAMPGLGGSGLGQGFGSGSGLGGSGGGGGGEVRLFGMREVATTVVIVFDISGSMIVGDKSPASYNILENEILQLIDSLGTRTRFGLVAFAKEGDPYRTQPAAATEDVKQNSQRWLKSRNPVQALDKNGQPQWEKYKNGRHSGTRADLGLERAFAMKPDVIFFVSDGEPSFGKDGVKNTAELFAQVQKWQAELPRPAKINTIAFLAGGGQAFMKRLAAENEGTFKEVNPR